MVLQNDPKYLQTAQRQISQGIMSNLTPNSLKNDYIFNMEEENKMLKRQIQDMTDKIIILAESCRVAGFEIIAESIEDVFKLQKKWTSRK